MSKKDPQYEDREMGRRVTEDQQTTTRFRWTCHQCKTICFSESAARVHTCQMYTRKKGRLGL